MILFKDYFLHFNNEFAGIFVPSYSAFFLCKAIFFNEIISFCFFFFGIYFDFGIVSELIFSLFIKLLFLE